LYCNKNYYILNERTVSHSFTHHDLLCEQDGATMPSDYLAGSINVNAVLVRKELSNLIKNHLVISQEGKNGGYKLAKPSYTDKRLASHLPNR
jgi:predicted transcriptional regulator